VKKRFWHGINKETNPCGFGCWQIAGKHSYEGAPHGWGDITETEAIDLLCYAIENGIDFFDTAQGYNYGQSERLLGKALKISGKEVVVCTKVSLTEDELKKKRIGVGFFNRVEQSLKNLQSSYIDILLIHNPPDDTDWKNLDYEILQKLVERGIIGTFGVSSRSLKGARSAIENRIGTTLEWVFNIFERRPIKVLFPIIEESKLNFIARSPLSRGLLNPKYIYKDAVFDFDDFRTTLPKEWINWTLNSLRIYHKNGVPEKDIINSALNFCLQYQQVNAIILGVKSKEQLDHYFEVSKSIHSNFNHSLLSSLPEFYPQWG
jgi:aryl-alcohol dehydrogenase-like predicted oxidoreductase